MVESGCVFDNFVVLVEYEVVKGVNLEKYDCFRYLLSWDEKKFFYKWKGGLEEFQNFSKEILEFDVLLMVSFLKLKFDILVFFNNIGIL